MTEVTDKTCHACRQYATHNCPSLAPHSERKPSGIWPLLCLTIFLAFCYFTAALIIGALK